LEKVVADLRQGSDINGAALVEGNDSIIACDLPGEGNSGIEIPEILSMIERWNASSLGGQNGGMFSQCILDYNGNKVIAKRMKNLTLLVMLQSQGYVGLAMLDIENSVRRIHEIMQE
jgi:predicted regulator of Ras-like GTPase activity (Roadblock/LC7/MglB family)